MGESLAGSFMRPKIAEDADRSYTSGVYCGVSLGEEKEALGCPPI
jgi:hypothetical protein